VTPSQPAFDPRRTAHRRPGLDLFRAVAIVFVVLYHAGLFGFALPFDLQRFGWIGVDLFFVLSGYLIAGQLFKSVRQGIAADAPGDSDRTAAISPESVRGGYSISRFYWRRALRILPAYLVVVAIYFFLPPSLREFPGMPPLWKFLTFTQNLGLRGGTTFSHAWSLCIEFQFYLLLPFLILVLARLRRGHVLVACAVFSWGVVIRGLLAHMNVSTPPPSWGWWQQWIYYPTYARLDSLTVGVSLAAIESFRPRWWFALMKCASWIWLPGLAAITVALILSEDGLSVVSSAFGFGLVAIGMGTFLICAVSPHLPLSRVPIPGAAFLATVAYSVYLSHKLPIHWIQQICAAHSVPPALAYLLMLGAILIIGSALFFAVERPILQVRQRVAEIK
jgi:peptidoglycan/LPS O-acetylase OafA/YrhL